MLAITVPMSLIIMVFTLIVAMTMSVSMTMLPSIFRNVYLVVPGILHKIDGLIAGIVGAAVAVPLLLLSGGHVHVDRLLHDPDVNRLDNDRLRIDQHWCWKVANL